MRGSTFIAFFGIATAISTSLIGCGDEDETQAPATPKVTKSAENESCVRTDDCESGLSCLNNVCAQSGSSTGGTGGSGPTTSPLGDVGETCSRSADCLPNLGCFNGRCAAEPTGEGGAPSVTLGRRGETCVVSSDCEAGLVCRPGGTQSPTDVAVGVCTETDTDIVPTGDVCGAECETDAHCCEIPVEIQAGIGARSCVELEDLLMGIDCATTMVAADLQRCFALTAYCECEADTWTCNSGACVYTATCSANGMVPGGCATVSRSGRPLNGTCDVADTELCQPGAVDPICVEADDCEGETVSDDMTMTDICVADECTCFQGGCYRKCSEDLDCRATLRCDTGAEVCVPVAACATDATCQARMNDVRATCVAMACTLPCETDLDCSPAGLTNGAFNDTVCHEGTCQDIGCSNDNECPGAELGARLFCTERAAAAGVMTWESAITE